jgi:hypothetical protein
MIRKLVTGAVIATLCSACSTGTPSRTAMNNYDLNFFQYDCSKSAQQMAFLNSMRRSSDDQISSVNGWLGVDRKTNWLIDYHIRYLRDYC